jgi:hypothetical protein
MVARFALLAGLALSLVLAPTASAAPSDRFAAHVGGAATGPGHRFMVGDGLNLVFTDNYRSYTSYKVCWTKGTGTRCWHRTTGRHKHKSVIFTASPSGIGTYRATWYVGGNAVAGWSFYNAIGD